MKIIATSDLHGTLPDIKEKCDAVVIAGDIVPLNVQRDFVRSIVWFSTEFLNWCEKLDCEKVFLVAGNHDFFFEKILKDAVQYMDCSVQYADSFGDLVISNKLLIPDKVVYLQDSKYVFHNKVIYGTPWCPSLKNWAFYKNDDELTEIFKRIPLDVDLLVTHAPGYKVNNTGVSLGFGYTPDYGSKELTTAVLDRNVKYWVCGHIHTGNHTMAKYDNTDMNVVNVSYKNEEYKPIFKPLVLEI